MTAYRFKALTANGQTRSGVMEADSERQIRQKLREEGHLPLEVTVVNSNHKNIKIKISIFYRFKASERLTFTRQLATLLGAGLTVEEALYACAHQTEKNSVKSIILFLRSKIMEGNTLSAALAHFPQHFNSVFRATVASGEVSGHLDIALLNLADYSEKQHELKQKIIQAILYPLVMTIVATGIVFFLLTWVVPPLVELFKDSEQTLPFSTRMLLAISSHLKIAVFTMGCILFTTTLSLRFLAKRNTQWKYRLHLYCLKIPFFGKFMITANVARFCHTLAILSKSGVSILDAINTSTSLINNLPIRQALEKACGKISEGISIHKSFMDTGYFPFVTLYLIGSGEKSGQLDNMFEKSAQNLENEIQRTINIMLTLFEPLLILVMGGIVMFIVLSILLPIFNLNQLIS